MAANPRQQERLLLSFQSYYADLYWFGAEDMIEELEYKLQMTQKEWYLWMLLLIYGFKGKNLTLFRNRLSEMLYATD